MTFYYRDPFNKTITDYYVTEVESLKEAEKEFERKKRSYYVPLIKATMTIVQ